MNATGTPNFWITEENYFQLTGPGFWTIYEVPQVRLSQLPSPFNLDKTVAVFASGVAPHVVDAPPGEKVGGIDWMRLEGNLRPTEPPLNVNHFVIGGRVDRRFPVFGPFRNGAIADHWTDGSDIPKYYPGENTAQL